MKKKLINEFDEFMRYGIIYESKTDCNKKSKRKSNIVNKKKKKKPILKNKK